MYDVSLYSTKKAAVQMNKFRQRDANHWKPRIDAVLSRAGDLRGKRVADLGAGVGTFALLAAQAGAARSVGVDGSAEMLAGAAELSREMDVRPELVCANVLRTGLPSESFDVVISADLIEHLSPGETVSFLCECGRLLTLGGSVVIYTWPARHAYLFETWPSRGLRWAAILPERAFSMLVRWMDRRIRKRWPDLEKMGLGYSLGHPNLLTLGDLVAAARAAGFTDVRADALDLYAGYATGDNDYRKAARRACARHEAFRSSLLLSATKPRDRAG